MTRQALELILELWDDPKPGHYKSKYWSFTVPEPVEEIGLGLHLKPYQKPHPPIALAGGLSAKSDTLRMAGELGFLPMSTNLVLPSVLKSHWENVEEGAGTTGKTPDRSTWRVARDIYVAENGDQGREEVLHGTMARDTDQYWMKLLPYAKMLQDLKTDPDMPDSAVTTDYLMEKVVIVGSPDEVADQVRQLYEDIGGFGALLVLGHEWQPRDQWVRSMTLLKQEVMPRLADLS